MIPTALNFCRKRTTPSYLQILPYAGKELVHWHYTCHKHLAYYRCITTSSDYWKVSTPKALVQTHYILIMGLERIQLQHQSVSCTIAAVVNHPRTILHWMIIYPLVIFWATHAIASFAFLHTTMLCISIDVEKAFSIFIFMRVIETTPTSSGSEIQQIPTELFTYHFKTVLFEAVSSHFGCT